MVIQQLFIHPIPSTLRKISSWLSYKFWYKEHEHREEPSLDLYTVLLIMSLVLVHHHTHIFTTYYLTYPDHSHSWYLSEDCSERFCFVSSLYSLGHYKTKQSKSSLFLTGHWSIITPNNCHRLHWQPCYLTPKPHHQRLNTLTFTIYHLQFCQSKTKRESLYHIFRWNITYFDREMRFMRLSPIWRWHSWWDALLS